MKKFIIIILLFVSSNILNAQLFRTTSKVGTTAAQFLKIGTDARSLALGSGAVALEGNISSLFWNPSGIASIKSNGSAMVTHSEWLAEINYNYASAILNLNEIGVIGLSFTSLGVPEEIVRTETNPQGDGRRWNANSFSLGVSFARSLTDKFSIGGTFKYIHEGIWNEKANGVAVDVGTIYTTDLNNLKIGASISNFGTKMQLIGTDINFTTNPNGEEDQGAQNINTQYQTDKFDLPLTFRVGISADAFKNEMFRTTFVLDAVHPNDNLEYLNLGGEFSYEETFFIRAGKKKEFLDETEQGFTFGLGFQLPISSTTITKLDYAFADYGRLENVQYVTLVIEF